MSTYKSCGLTDCNLKKGKMKENSFYEVLQQVNSGAWIHLAFFKTKRNAEAYKAEFNIGAELRSVKVLKRGFLEDKNK